MSRHGVVLARVVLACRVADAIRRGDDPSPRALLARHPRLLFEDERGGPGNWGPPLSHAANLGRRRVGPGPSWAKRLRFVSDEQRREYRDVTPLGLGRRLHDQDRVARPVMALLEARGASA